MKRIISNLGVAAAVAAGVMIPASADAQGLNRAQEMRSTKSRAERIEQFNEMRGKDGQRTWRGISATPEGYGKLPKAKARNISTIPAMTEASAPARSAQEPRGSLYGVVSSFKGIVSTDQGFWGRIDTKTGAVDRIYSGSVYMNGAQDYDFQGGAVRDNILYIPRDNSDPVSGNQGCVWKRVDLATGQVLPVIDNAFDYTCMGYTMTYNPSIDAFQVVGFNANTAAGQYTLVYPNDKDNDPYNDWEFEPVEFIGGRSFIAALAYNPADGNTYAFDDLGDVYTLEAKTGEMTLVGTLEYDGVIFTQNYTGAVVYSPLDEAFITYYLDNGDMRGHLLYIDPETWYVENGVAVDENVNPWIANLYCPDPFATAGSPEQPAVPVINFDGPALNGSFTYTVPTMTYAGLQITAPSVNVIIKVDGKEMVNKSVAPGFSETVDLSLEEGLHSYSMICMIGDETSPERKVDFFVGYDAPKAPTALKYSNGTITWTAPTGSANNGYIDLADVTYNVYVDGVKQNKNPIKECTYTLKQPDTQKLSSISVKAETHGKESAETSLYSVIGRSFSVPVTFKPTTEEAVLFSVTDANRDGVTFSYEPESTFNDAYFQIFDPANTGFNDWLILPQINFSDVESLYHLSMSARPSSPYSEGEHIQIFIGKERNVASMTEMVYDNAYFNTNNEFVTLDVKFPVAEAGDYYIGIKCATETNDGAGVVLSDFKVDKVDGAKSSAPANAAKVEIEAAPYGELSSTVSVTVPTVDLIGRPLAADKPVSVKIVCVDEVANVSALPGAVATAELPVYEDGYALYEVTLSNADGEGLTTLHRKYVGKDSPTVPKNVKLHAGADNKSVKITWDKVGEVGLHGGYVDPAEVEYPIYYFVSGLMYALVDVVKDGDSYEWKNINIPVDPCPAGNSQYEFVMGVTARNDLGECDFLDYHRFLGGDPFPLPAYEEFGNSGFTYGGSSGYLQSMTGEFENSAWQSIASARSVLGSFMQFENDAIDGCLMAYSTAAYQTRGELKLKRFSMDGVKNPVFTFRYLDYSHAVPVEVWACHYGDQEFRKIGESVPQHPEKARFEDVQIDIPEDFIDQPWAEFRFRMNLPYSDLAYTFIDNYGVSQNVDYDLKLASVTGPSLVTVGDTKEYMVRVSNFGKEPISSSQLTVAVVDENGKTLDYAETALRRINVQGSVDNAFTFTFKEEYASNKNLKVVATVNAAEDEIANNNVLELPITLVASQIPVVGDLAAKWSDDHKDAVITWSTPDLTYGGEENFDIYNAFEVNANIGPFKNVKLDKGTEVFDIEGVSWPMSSAPQGWTVLNAEELGVQNDETLAPHSGSSYIIARTNAYNEDDFDSVIQSEDFLVSPQVVPGSKISFYINILSASYPEYVELWESSTDDTLGEKINTTTLECGSFKRTRTFSKSDLGWDYVEVDLQADTKYFALVYRSYDSFGCMIDDLFYSPVEKQTWEVAYYNLWATTNGDWNTWRQVGGDITDNSFTVKDHADENTQYYLTTVVRTPDGRLLAGPRSNKASLYNSAVGEIVTEGSVAGEKGAIVANGFNGELIAIYTLDGKLVKRINVSSDSISIPMEAGIYLVRIGKESRKVVVK